MTVQLYIYLHTGDKQPQNTHKMNMQCLEAKKILILTRILCGKLPLSPAEPNFLRGTQVLMKDLRFNQTHEEPSDYLNCTVSTDIVILHLQCKFIAPGLLSPLLHCAWHKMVREAQSTPEYCFRNSQDRLERLLPKMCDVQKVSSNLSLKPQVHVMETSPH